MNSTPDLRGAILDSTSGDPEPAWMTTQRLMRAIAERFAAGRCAQVAASLAFTTLLSLVPFITLVAVVLSRFPQSSQVDAAFQRFLLDNLLPEKAGKVIATYALQFSQKATNLTIVGTLVIVVTAIMLMRTIDKVINQIWMVRSVRSWATRYAAYWMALSVGPLLLAGGVFLASAMLSMSLDVMNEPVWLAASGFRLISLAILGGVFGAIYYAVPHCSVRGSDALFAGFLAAFGFLIMQRVFGLYVSHFPNYTLVYGAFAAVPIFLMWLYLSWIVVLLGAVVAAVLPERHARRYPLPPFPGRSVYLSLLVLVELALAQRTGDSRHVDVLSVRARCNHADVREILSALEGAGIVARLDRGGWLLARAAEAVRVVEVGNLFGWRPLPATLLESDENERLVRACWNRMLNHLDDAMPLTLGDLIRPVTAPCRS